MNNNIHSRLIYMFLAFIVTLGGLLGCKADVSGGGGSGTQVSLETINLTYLPINELKDKSLTDGSPTWDHSTAITATYAVTPDLPEGLTLDPATGIITGTPTATQAPTDYTMTATGTGSFSGTATAVIRIGLFSPDVGDLTLSYENIDATQGEAITSSAPQWAELEVTATYTVTPDLPEGLTLDPATGIISGTTPADTLQDLTDYTVKAEGTGDYSGEQTAVLKISVSEAGIKVSAFTLSYDDISVVQNISITSEPTWTDPLAADPDAKLEDITVTYTVTPALPTGLTLAEDTGIISGTPTDVQVGTGYTIVARGTGKYSGIREATIDIAINAQRISLKTLSFKYAVITSIPDAGITKDPIWNTVPTATYAVAPDLPDGLALNEETGRISGAATEIQAKTDYILTATGTGTYFDSKTAILSITIREDQSSIAELEMKYFLIDATQDTAIKPTVPTWEPDEPTAVYSVTPPLPEGLTMNPATGIISGVPGEPQLQTKYTVTASGTGAYTGQKTATLDIVVQVNILRRWKKSSAYNAIVKDTESIAISNVAGLKAINEKGTYHLANDIDLGATEWAPISIFKGTLNGNGYLIYNLNIQSLSTTYQGLFARLEGANVKDLGIGVRKVAGKAMVGALAAHIHSGTAVENVAVGPMNEDSEIIAVGTYNNFSYLGGIVGYLDSGTAITNVVNEGLTVRTTGTSSNHGQVGGLAGHSKGTVTGYSSGTVSSSAGSRVGGLVGQSNTGAIVRGVFQGTVKSTSGDYVGGIVGEALGSQLKGISAGRVHSDSGDYIGGLAGRNYTAVVGISDSIVTGNTDGSWIGGLVGNGRTTVTGYTRGWVMVDSNSDKNNVSTSIGYREYSSLDGTYYNSEGGDHVGTKDAKSTRKINDTVDGATGERGNTKAGTPINGATNATSSNMTSLGGSDWSFTAGQWPKLNLSDTLLEYLDFDYVNGPPQPSNFFD